MENLIINWDAAINTFAGKQGDDASLLISGELVNTSVCANNFAVDEKELLSLSEQASNVTLRIDHSRSVRDIVGGVTKGIHDPTNKRVMFEAEVDDPYIQRAISKGRLKYVSIGATADAFCSVCGKPSKPKLCRCKNFHDIIKNIKLKEVSIITDPAYSSSEFRPVSFIAGIDLALAKNLNVTPERARLSEKNKKMEEREMSTNEKFEATTLKPAGADAVVLLGEQIAKLEERFKKYEDEARKKDEDERKKDEAKKKEDEAKKEEAAFTKLEQAIAGLGTKLEEAFKVKVKDEDERKKESDEEEEDEAKKKDSDEEDEAKKKEHPSGPDPTGKVAPPLGKSPTRTSKQDKATFTNIPTSPGIPKDVKHEQPPDGTEPDEDDKPVKKEIGGAKIGDANETQVEITAQDVPAWFNEVKAFARRNNILESY